MFGTCTYSMTHNQTYLFLCLSISVFLLYKFIYSTYKFVSKALYIQPNNMPSLLRRRGGGKK